MRKAWVLASRIARSVVSVLVLGYSILLGGGSPLLFLWGLWLEEVLAYAGLSVRITIARRAGAAGKLASPLGLYSIFAAAHLVFVLVFTWSATTGIFLPPGAPLVETPSPAAIAWMAGAFLFWNLVDIAQALVRARRNRSPDDEIERINREANLALVLPHVTIIAGGFCLVMFELGNWLAVGILAGKILFELLSFVITRAKPAPPTAS
jgi:hypothetical protein